MRSRTERPPPPAPRTRLFRALAFTAPLVALWLVPVLALAVVVPLATSREASSVESELPVTATVGSREDDYRQTVTATFQVTAPHDVVVPAAGLVTAVHASPGQVLAPTDAVVSVDGAVLRAHVAEAPLYREIGPGTSGADVEGLRDYLAAAGSETTLGRGASYSPSLRRAITAYQRANGFPADGVFQPSSVVFVPAGSPSVQSVLTSVGEMVALGDPVIAGPVLPLSLTLSAESTLRLAGKDGPFALLLSDEEVPVTSLAPAPEEVHALHAALVSAAERGTVDLTTDDTTQSFTGLVLHLPDAPVRGTVPTTAVYTTAAGTRCVFSTDETRSTGVVTSADAIPLTDATTVDGEIGLASVPADLVGQTVVRNPRSLPGSVLDDCA
ncbi:putative peptidoglycan binding protein [Sanguibacter keddieii DSM 10542]|uniref:Peptidoglycan binding protein n=1 Tax=Sanguibacter keddieii (strain ATCC 51767 / DSM 10542 / NCFB 3025 / ST-74) TaxID=446469 RepID=D1BE32_SANKS|nr:peptidoglycan-binding domain-containing protein [Sanguibacter keddieii]ACZ23253.1 putative peptidoglycan binding protein [Sanguibacter keddieii DSM 10542]